METHHTALSDDWKTVEENGEVLFLVSGVDHLGSEKSYAVSKSQLEKHHRRGSNVKLAQFMGLVVPGLVLVEHVFEGLRRPLCVGENMEADKAKLAYTWKPAWDFWWNEAYRFDSRQLEFREPPNGKVFVVIVSPNAAKHLYPSADYWIERWYWVRCSDTLIEAPTDWEKRYDRQLK